MQCLFYPVPTFTMKQRLPSMLKASTGLIDRNTGLSVVKLSDDGKRRH